MNVFLGVQSYFISCDNGWTGFSESPSCYLFSGRQRETFQDAQNICQNYGAKLAKIDTEAEKVSRIQSDLYRLDNYFFCLSEFFNYNDWSSIQ